MTRENRQKRNEEICKLRKSDLTIQEIAEKFSISEMTVHRALSANNIYLGTTEHSKEMQRLHHKPKPLKAIDEVVSNIHTQQPNWEYVEGYTGCDGYAYLRHIPCGVVARKSLERFRRKNANITCPYCEAQKRQWNEWARKEEQRKLSEQKQKAKEQAKLANDVGVQIELKVCPVCSAPFIGKRKYCSDDCARKIANKKDKRIKRLKDQCVDTDITVDTLIARDGCACYICGGECDLNDYEMRNGTFIAGAMYPSADHVQPLAKGGLHSWDNVRLAHRKCNWEKSDKLIAV